MRGRERERERDREREERERDSERREGEGERKRGREMKLRLWVGRDFVGISFYQHRLGLHYPIPLLPGSHPHQPESANQSS